MIQEKQEDPYPGDKKLSLILLELLSWLPFLTYLFNSYSSPVDPFLLHSMETSKHCLRFNAPLLRAKLCPVASLQALTVHILTTGFSGLGKN